LFSLQDIPDNEVEPSLTPTGGVTPSASSSNLTFNFRMHESEASQCRDEQELPPSSPPQPSPPDPYCSTIFNDEIIDDDFLPLDRGQAELEDFENAKPNLDCGGQPIEWTAGSV
jgi:hypothetical protein